MSCASTTCRHSCARNVYIDVRHVDQVANQIVSAQRGRLALLSASDEKALWRQVIETSNLRVGEEGP